MGGCFCHPVTDIEQDPSVSCHIHIQHVVIATDDGFPTYSDRTGIMYVRDGRLYYRTLCGSGLLCSPLGFGIELEAVQTVEVVHDQTLSFSGDQLFVRIALSPGIRIVAAGKRKGNTTLILIQTADAVDFAEKVDQARLNL